jgi:hypothetical protein
MPKRQTLQALLTPTEARAPGGGEKFKKGSGGEEELQGHVVLALGKLAVSTLPKPHRISAPPSPV